MQNDWSGEGSKCSVNRGLLLLFVQLLMPVTETSRGLGDVKAERGLGKGEVFMVAVTVSFQGREVQEDRRAES